MIDKLKKLRVLFGPSDWLRFGLIVVLMLGATVFELLGLGVVPLFVMALAQPETVAKYPAVVRLLAQLGIDNTADMLVFGAMALVVLFALRTVYLVASYYIQDRITRNRQVALSHRLFAAYMNAPYQFHLRRNSAELLRNATQEIDRVISEVVNPALTVLRQGLVMVAVVAMVVYAEPLIGVGALFLIGCTGLAFLWFMDARMKREGELEQAMRGEQYRTVNEGFSVFKELRVMGREQGFTQRFHRCAETMARPQRWRDTARRSIWPVMELVVVAGLLTVLGIMVRSGRELSTLMPMLALFTVALARLKGCATEFVCGFAQMRYNWASVEVVANDLTELHAGAVIAAPAPAVPLTLKPDSVLELSGVSFRYLADRPPVLHDVSLRIPRGACVGFVGPTGSGKSTILDLIMGVLQPDAGQILLDGEDIQPRLRSWQACVGYIPQQITLLDDSVAANVALGVLPGQQDATAQGRPPRRRTPEFPRHLIVGNGHRKDTFMEGRQH